MNLKQVRETHPQKKKSNESLAGVVVLISKASSFFIYAMLFDEQ